jgi:hypothetical protein
VFRISFPRCRFLNKKTKFKRSNLTDTINHCAQYHIVRCKFIQTLNNHGAPIMYSPTCLCSHLCYAVTSVMQSPLLCSHLCYVVTSVMQSPLLCSHLCYAVTSVMQSPLLCSYLCYAVTSVMQSPLLCSHLCYAVTSVM